MKKPKLAKPAISTPPALTVENLAVAVERGVRAAIRPDTPPVDHYADKAQATRDAPVIARMSSIARAIDALAGLQNLEGRIHGLMANLVGSPPDGAQGTESRVQPSGVLGVLETAADDAIARTERIHGMLGQIERALP